MTLPQLQSLLLDLIAPLPQVDAARLDALKGSDWERLLGMIRQHRLGPLLHWQLNRCKAQLPIPKVVKEELARRFKASALRSLTLQRELLLVHRILDKAGFPHVALKGAYLALHAYPQAALRPMRDLDILVARDKGLDAYQALLDGGLKRMDHCQGSPEACLQRDKHLPPLHSPNGCISVELHVRLIAPKSDDELQADLSDDPQFWQRCINAPLADDSICFESPTDLLLHMICHAVYDHKFNNGPLLLSDLAYLLDSHKIDWPLFWRLAERGQQTRGCLLTLNLTERYWGTKTIAWPEGIEVHEASMASQVDNAALLLLQDFEACADVNLAVRVSLQTSIAGKAGALLGKAFPRKTSLAVEYPVSEHSRWIYLWYPVRWWRLVIVRLPALLRSLRQDHLRAEAKTVAGLEEWLNASPSGKG